MKTEPTISGQQVSRRGTVVLVDEMGAPLGSAEKLAAHRSPGLLHLAFSVVLYRSDGRTLLQQRAASKYHFPLAWANACCSHPAPGEDIVASAESRVREELGLDCRLTDVGTITYRAECSHSGLVEHELDHVLVGVVTADPEPDPGEVERFAWADPDEVIGSPPEGAAPWLEPVLRLARSVAGRKSD